MNAVYFMNTIWFNLILLVVGFVFLIKGADFFVEGASSVAKKLCVPSLIIGMTIVAMGTSLPETAVSVSASMRNQNSLAVSNVVGSNIFNLMVVLGFCALFVELKVSRAVLRRDYPFSVACAVLLLVTGVVGMTLSHFDGIVYLIIFCGFIIFMIHDARRARKNALSSDLAEERSLADEFEEEVVELSTPKSIIYLILGCVAIKYGGDWVVSSASFIAKQLGVSSTIIGLTICAFGTSLPELVTSIAAARKDELDMAIGNVVGSNVFNILMVLGVAGAISPIGFIRENVIDIVVLLAFSLLVWLFCVTKKHIGRIEGIVMLVLYTIYVVYICLREVGAIPIAF